MLRCLLLLLSATAAACTVEQAPLVAENVVLTRPLPGTSMGAAYMTLRNTGEQAIAISRVASTDGVAVAMHESVLDSGIARMRELQTLTIPARQSVVFEPGGRHLMLRYPAAAPELVTLQFFADQALLLAIQVPTRE